MKKILFLFAALIFALSLWAQEEFVNDELAIIDEFAVLEESVPDLGEAYPEEVVLGGPDLKEETHPEEFVSGRGESKKRFKNRGFELGIVDVNFGASNNFLGFKEIFTETLVIDMEKLNKGFRVDMGMDIRPLYFSVNRKDEWGFGLDIGRITAFGNLDVSGNVLGFKKTDGENDKFGVGAAAFVEVGVPVFFHINKLNGFKVKIRPAGYVPVIYLEPDFNYSHTESRIELGFAFQLYAPMSLDPDSDGSLDFSLGFDFSAGVEYPLLSRLDLGVDFINIPLVPGSLSQYMRMKDGMAFDSNEIGSGSDPGDVLEMGSTEPVYGAEKKTILRPFKTVFYANYRPLDKEIITIIPRIGFAINPLYAKPASLEAGADARFDLNNMLIGTLGINYGDRVWKNSLDFAFNLRAFEFDIGVSMQSPDFVKSWQLAGLGINLGFKFGW